MLHSNLRTKLQTAYVYDYAAIYGPVFPVRSPEALGCR